MTDEPIEPISVREFAEAMSHHSPWRFYLERTEDESGVSGTGIVADGVRFYDGRTVIHWYNDVNENVETDGNGLAIYDSLEDAEQIHGHGGRTRFVFIDGPDRVTDTDPCEEDH